MVGNKEIPKKGMKILVIFPKWDKIRNAPDFKNKTDRILDKTHG
jgi:hypothetical protein